MGKKKTKLTTKPRWLRSNNELQSPNININKINEVNLSGGLTLAVIANEITKMTMKNGRNKLFK